MSSRATTRPSNRPGSTSRAEVDSRPVRHSSPAGEAHLHAGEVAGQEAAATRGRSSTRVVQELPDELARLAPQQRAGALVGAQDAPEASQISSAAAENWKMRSR